jgi:multicomponent Na+:H+ antiporter subunit C
VSLLLAIVIGVIFAVSVYLLTAGEVKSACMGAFLLGQGANLTLLSSSGSPLIRNPQGELTAKAPPVLPEQMPTGGEALNQLVQQTADPLPQALILTAIVIGFAIQAFILTMIVVTWRRSRSLLMEDLDAGAALEGDAA